MARFGLVDSDDEDRSSNASSTETSESRSAQRTRDQTPTSHNDDDDLDSLDDDDDDGEDYSQGYEDDDAPPRASLVSSGEDEEMDQLSTTSTTCSTRRTPSPPRGAAAAPLARRTRQPTATANATNHGSPWAQQLKLEPKRVQVMQASFFGQTTSTPAAARVNHRDPQDGDDDDEDESDEDEFEHRSRKRQTVRPEQSFAQRAANATKVSYFFRNSFFFRENRNLDSSSHSGPTKKAVFVPLCRDFDSGSARRSARH